MCSLSSVTPGGSEIQGSEERSCLRAGDQADNGTETTGTNTALQAFCQVCRATHTANVCSSWSKLRISATRASVLAHTHHCSIAGTACPARSGLPHVLYQLPSPLLSQEVSSRISMQNIRALQQSHLQSSAAQAPIHRQQSCSSPQFPGLSLLTVS